VIAEISMAKYSPITFGRSSARRKKKNTVGALRISFLTKKEKEKKKKETERESHCFDSI